MFEKLSKENLQLLLHVLDTQILSHPFPWRVQKNWVFEVVASDGILIARTSDKMAADGIVAFAALRKKELEEMEKQVTSP